MHRLRCADTGDYVFALGVDQEFAEHHVFTSAGVAGETDAGGAVIAHVAEHHGLDVDRGAVGQIRGDLEFAAVVDRTLAHPGIEHGLDRQFELLENVFRERPAGCALHHVEEDFADFTQVVGAQIEVVFGADAFLQCFERFVEFFVGDAECDLAEQLDEAPVGVIAEAFVAGELDQSGQVFGVQAEVQDGVHHAGHRQRRAGTYGYQ